MTKFTCCASDRDKYNRAKGKVAVWFWNGIVELDAREMKCEGRHTVHSNCLGVTGVMDRFVEKKHNTCPNCRHDFSDFFSTDIEANLSSISPRPAREHLASNSCMTSQYDSLLQSGASDLSAAAARQRATCQPQHPRLRHRLQHRGCLFPFECQVEFVFRTTWRMHVSIS